MKSRRADRRGHRISRGQGCCAVPSLRPQCRDLWVLVTKGTKNKVQKGRNEDWIEEVLEGKQEGCRKERETGKETVRERYDCIY